MNNQKSYVKDHFDLIVEAYDKGHKLSKLANRLNAAGHRTVRGKRYSAAIVSGMCCAFGKRRGLGWRPVDYKRPRKASALIAAPENNYGSLEAFVPLKQEENQGKVATVEQYATEKIETILLRIVNSKYSDATKTKLLEAFL